MVFLSSWFAQIAEPLWSMRAGHGRVAPAGLGLDAAVGAARHALPASATRLRTCPAASAPQPTLWLYTASAGCWPRSAKRVHVGKRSTIHVRIGSVRIPSIGWLPIATAEVLHVLLSGWHAGGGSVARQHAPESTTPHWDCAAIAPPPAWSIITVGLG